MLNDSKLNLSILINIHLYKTFWSSAVYVVRLEFFFDTLYIGIRIQIYFLLKKFQKASVEYLKKFCFHDLMRNLGII